MKTFYLADIISLQVKRLLFLPSTPNSFLLPLFFYINSEHLCSSRELLLLYSLPAFAFSVGCNNQTLFWQTRSGPYNMDYLANCFSFVCVLQKHCHWSSISKAYCICLTINSVSNLDPGFSMVKGKEVKSTEDRLLIQVSISSPFYILSTQE